MNLPKNQKNFKNYVWPKRPKVKPPRPIKGTKVIVLGCGTSSGIPLLGCKCFTCSSTDPRNHRTRASIYLQVKSKTFLIDTAPDLRQQAFRENITWIDAILYTHPHADHIHGIDELRSFNFIMARHLPCYGNRWTINSIRDKFDYIFKYTQEGGGKPKIDLHLITKPMRIHGVKVTPLPLIHGALNVLGYRINDVAYLTDCSYIPEKTLAMMKGLKVLILDCLRLTPHSTHLNVEQSLFYAKKIGAKKTYFTHMGHELEYSQFRKSLPRSMQPAYDGLVIRVTDSAK